VQAGSTERRRPGQARRHADTLAGPHLHEGGDPVLVKLEHEMIVSWAAWVAGWSRDCQRRPRFWIESRHRSRSLQGPLVQLRRLGRPRALCERQYVIQEKWRTEEPFSSRMMGGAQLRPIQRKTLM
jgi:hypothetical protein